MAYTRQEEETFEIDYPITQVWEAIPKALEQLDWKLEQSDNERHQARVRTKSAFLSYSTVLTIEGSFINEKTCKVTVRGETPVTTITAMADFGRTRERIETFFAALAKQLDAAKNA